MKHSLIITYAFLIILLIALPHVISGHVYVFSEENAESLATIAIILTAYIAFRIHKHVLEQSENVQKKLSHNLKTSTKQLTESYQYIGTINRKLSLLHEVTTNALEHPRVSKRERKELIKDLLNTATHVVAKAEWGRLRVVDTGTQKTDREFTSDSNARGTIKLQISNKALVTHNGHEEKMHTMDNVCVLRSSDTQSVKQCFLLFPKTTHIQNDDLPLLQSITDKIQLFYKYLYE